MKQFGVEKHEMASVMGICAGLVGPKSENVKEVLVFEAFFEGSRGPKYPNRAKNRPRGSIFWSAWGRFLAYECDFGSLWDHFEILVQ